jgi:hypothetical protein
MLNFPLAPPVMVYRIFRKKSKIEMRLIEYVLWTLFLNGSAFVETFLFLSKLTRSCWIPTSSLEQKITTPSIEQKIRRKFSGHVLTEKTKHIILVLRLYIFFAVHLQVLADYLFFSLYIFGLNILKKSMIFATRHQKVDLIAN